jgi:hypothetical protein
MTREWADRLE